MFLRGFCVVSVTYDGRQKSLPFDIGWKKKIFMLPFLDVSWLCQVLPYLCKSFYAAVLCMHSCVVYFSLFSKETFFVGQFYHSSYMIKDCIQYGLHIWFTYMVSLYPVLTYMTFAYILYEFISSITSQLYWRSIFIFQMNGTTLYDDGFTERPS